LLDKLDLRVHGKVHFTESFNRLYAGERNNPKRWKSTKHYAASASFEDCGIEAIVHMQCQMTKQPMHKLEILRVGEKTIADVLEISERIFETEPFNLGVMRVDLTADVAGVPVDWFKRHTLPQHKQTRRQIGKFESFQTVSKGTAETLYAGVKPNQIRIYDKVGERRMQYQKKCAHFVREHSIAQSVLKAEQSKAGYWAEWVRAVFERDEVAPLPGNILDGCEMSSFEDLYGHGMWDTITRVERQAGTSREIQKLGLATLRQVQLHADKLDPFSSMLFFDTADGEPKIEDWGWADWHCGMDLRRRVEMFGIAEVEREMKAHLKTNFYRERKKWAPFLRLNSNVVGIDSAGLRKAYQQSTARQLLRAA
jgi:hypothetical protein